MCPDRLIHTYGYGYFIISERVRLQFVVFCGASIYKYKQEKGGNFIYEEE